MTILSAFAWRMLELRCAQHMTQKDLAAQAGLSERTIISLERGTYDPTVTTIARLQKVADALGGEVVVTMREKNGDA